METPNTKAGVVTESIMQAFSSLAPERIVELDTPQYNRVYSHVLKTLEQAFEQEYCLKDAHPDNPNVVCLCPKHRRRRN